MKPPPEPCETCGEFHPTNQTKHDDPGDFSPCGRFNAERFFERKRDEVQGWWRAKWEAVKAR